MENLGKFLAKILKMHNFKIADFTAWGSVFF